MYPTARRYAHRKSAMKKHLNFILPAIAALLTAFLFASLAAADPFPDIYSVYDGTSAAPTAEDITVPDITSSPDESLFSPDTDEPVTIPQTEPATEPITEPLTAPVTVPVTVPATEPQTAPETASPTEPEVSPRIGISYGGTNTEYCRNMIVKSGATPVYLPLITDISQAEKLVSELDGIVFTGGEDINPELYGEKKLYDNVSINDTRDASDMLLINAALDANLPMLCICRGMQLLNVALGGTLYQDIPTQVSSSIYHRDPSCAKYQYHTLYVNESSVLYSEIVKSKTVLVNSWHHQAIKTPGKGVIVTATAVADGIVEAIELEDNPYVIGVQFHPELGMREFFDNLKYNALTFRDAGRKLPGAQ